MDREENQNGANHMHCLECDYDLAGLHDSRGPGVCPECGTAFGLTPTGAAPRPRPGLAWIPALLMCVLCVPLQGPGENAFGSTLETSTMLLILLLWFISLWREGARLWRFPRCLLLLRVSLVAVRGSVGMMIGGGDHVQRGVSLLALGWASHAVVWSVFSREVALLAVIAGIYVAIPGVLMLATIPDRSGSTHWSAWPDPRIGQVHRQYPLTQREAMAVASPLAAAGSLLVIAGAIGHIRTTRRRWLTDRAPSEQDAQGGSDHGTSSNDVARVDEVRDARSA